MSRIVPEPLRVNESLPNIGESKPVLPVLDARLVPNYKATEKRPTTWSNPCTDCCGAPGGWRICSYVLFFPFCAAGDIARESGRDYLISAIMYPLCGWWLAGDRQALAMKYNIDDPLEGPASYCFMCCGCSFFLLVQEMNEILLRRTASASSFKSGTGTTATGNNKLGGPRG